MNEDISHTNDTELPTEEPVYLLCVDDDKDMLTALVRLLRNEPCTVLTATSGKEALAILKETKNIGLILCDERMPEMSGTTFLEEAKTVAPDTIRIIVTGYSDLTDAVNAINRGGAMGYFNKPWDEAELLKTVRKGLQKYRLARENQSLQEQLRQQSGHLEEWNSNLKRRVIQQTAVIRQKLEELSQQKTTIKHASDAMLLMFVHQLQQRQQHLSKHCRNVVALTDSMTATLKLPPDLCEEIRTAAILHDIGLFYVTDHLQGESIPPKNTDEYKSHCVEGEELLSLSEEFKKIALIVRHHHEEYDGSGFPDGLSGDQIPLGLRIIHVASFIDNTYAQETGADAEYQVNCKLAAVMGSHFDPALAPAAYQAVKDVLMNPELQWSI
jgi:putative nucleotidyltransferase with HDIG domain